MTIGFFLDSVSYDEDYDNIKFSEYSKIRDIDGIFEDIKTEIIDSMEESYRESREEFTEHIKYENTDESIADLEEVNESIDFYKNKIKGTYTSFGKCKILNELLEDFELHYKFKVRFIEVQEVTILE